MLIDIQTVFIDAKTIAKYKENRYPFVSYTMMDAKTPDHSHPLWEFLDAAMAKKVSDFFVTQKQAKESIDVMYKAPFYQLVDKDAGLEQWCRWCEADEQMLKDLAEHYVQTYELNKVLSDG